MRQAWTAEVTAPGVDRVVADKAQTYCPRLEGLGPWFLRSRNCLDTYELLNKLRLSDTLEERIFPMHVTSKPRII